MMMYVVVLEDYSENEWVVLGVADSLEEAQKRVQQDRLGRTKHGEWKHVTTRSPQREEWILPIGGISFLITEIPLWETKGAV